MVMPEDKYAIVKTLQTGKRRHVVGTLDMKGISNHAQA